MLTPTMADTWLNLKQKDIAEYDGNAPEGRPVQR
jgi:hypothetical protein